jgi:hypothetical protein
MTLENYSMYRLETLTTQKLAKVVSIKIIPSAKRKIVALLDLKHQTNSKIQRIGKRINKSHPHPFLED